MPLDPHCARVLKLLGAAAGQGVPTPPQRRQALDDLARLATGEAIPAQVEDLVAQTAGGPLRLRSYAPPDAVPELRPTLIYLHGGGWVAGSLETHDSVCRALAIGGGFRVFAVDYRLAPEHPLPAGLDDAVAAVRWIVAHAADVRADPHRLVLAGDSAGGALAASAASMLQREGASPIAALLLLCPIVDIGGDHPSRETFGEGHFITRAALAADTADYLGREGRVDDPKVAPLRAADLSGYPATHIHLAEFDPFHDEGVAFGGRLSGAGVPVQVTVHPGMIHYFYALPRLVPYARQALAEIAGQLRDAVG